MSGPYQNFVRRLCKDQGLVDVAGKGHARQSSTSRWSKPGDAQRAVQGVNADYAFHTDREMAPWWMLEFEAPQVVAQIVLHNRRRPKYQDVSRNLLVELRDDAGWRAVYRGDTAFGAEPAGQPLVISFDPAQEATAVRVTSQVQGYLHLSQVNVLSPSVGAALQTGIAPVFLACRADGFGERLRAILNALVLAEHMGGGFAFNWRDIGQQSFQDHSVLPVTEVFSGAFIAEHGMSNDRVRDMFKGLLKGNVRKDASGAPVFEPFDALVVNQQSLLDQAPIFKGEIDVEKAYGAAFAKIAFAPKFQAAKDAACAAGLGEGPTVAVHLRAGDIIFGRYRFMGRYHGKVCPYPLARRIISDLTKAGNRVVLFGQDDALCAYFKDRFGVMLAAEVAEPLGFDAAQQALFEICLMARCGRIICGSSGFAVAAAWIGGIKTASPHSLFSPDEILSITRAAIDCDLDDDRISDLQRGFACWSAFHAFGYDVVTDEVFRGLLHKAKNWDPENGFYQLVHACDCYAQGQHDKAEHLLYSRLIRAGKKPGSMYQTLTLSLPDNTVPASPYVEILKDFADKGHAMAALAAALSVMALGDIPTAAHYATLYFQTRSDAQSGLDRLLDHIQKPQAAQ
ncbi:MAG: discoidin domain-containing protein [Sulfitobacter sp.]